jgi:hypothetical protein
MQARIGKHVPATQRAENKEKGKGGILYSRSLLMERDPNKTTANILMTDLAICDILESSFSLEILLATVLLFRKERVGFKGAAIFLNTVVPWRWKTRQLGPLSVENGTIYIHCGSKSSYYHKLSYYHTTGISYRKYDPGCLSRIRIPGMLIFYQSRIPEPRVKKGTGSRIRNAEVMLIFSRKDTIGKAIVK